MQTDLRHLNLKTRIGFSTQTTNPFSAMIRKFTGGQCSHVWWLYYDLDFGIDMVMDAHETGYRLVPLTMFMQRNKIIATIDPIHDVDEALLHSVQWLGSMYDFAGLIGGLWVMLGRIFRRKWKNPMRSSANVFCSEATARGLLSQKYPGFENVDPETLTPDDILKFFRSEKGPK